MPVAAQSQAPATTCEPWAARLISYQGTLLARRASGVQQASLGLQETFCVGDVLEVGSFSRAALQLPDQTVVRLDQGTVVTFAAPQDDKRSWLDILKGAIHIISRDPRALRVITPFANAGIEGTEFLVRVDVDTALVLVYEGSVKVQNPLGEATAGTGQSVVAKSGSAPVLQQVVRPRDQVVWTLYYPPTGSGPLPGADAAVGEPSPEFLVGRAEQRLAVGRVSEAEADLASALATAPGSAEVLARQSVIALTKNDAATARDFADRAVIAAPASASARLAQSYARQSAGDLASATETLEAAAVSNPDNALVRARLAELYLAAGDVDRSEASAKAAVAADPELGLAQTILGFVRLTRIQLDAAISTFEEAIRLEPGAPLPRLGLGLARIRGGDLEAGRADIETAVILDPGNSLIRSYMGKAYYEEKHDKLAASQLEIAKDLDPNDPTPWFYDAIRKQTINDPVGALADVQEAISRNAQRTVYRSQLLIDADLAARSSARGRIYQDLGFAPLALREGWRAVDESPGDFSGHRLLADSYASRPRSEIARVNELQQSQMLQPLNMTPIQPQLGQSTSLLVDGAGPTSSGFNEFNPLFSRDGLAMKVSAVVGGNDTWGNDASLSGINGRWSFSLGQYHYETDGFREDNAIDQDILNAIVQVQLSPDTSVLAEVRSSERDAGDLALRFDPTSYIAGLSENEDSESARLGVRHRLSPRASVLGLVSYQWGDFRTVISDFLDSSTDADAYTAELQYLFDAEQWDLISGVRYSDQSMDSTTTIQLPFPPFDTTEQSSIRTDALNVYVYGRREVTEQITVTVGLSADFLDGVLVSKDRVSPKVGVVWQPTDQTTIRAGAFQVLPRLRLSRQDIQPALEPTSVAGFNQFYLDSEGEESSRVGVGLDQVVSPTLFVGMEFSRRERDVPYFFAPPDPFTEGGVSETEADETSASAYTFWNPTANSAVSLEYQYDKFQYSPDFDPQGFLTLESSVIPVGTSYFWSSGWSSGATVSYIRQQGLFRDQTVPFFQTFTDRDSAFVADAYLSFRLPSRRGVVRLEARNLFDREFRFQEPETTSPRFAPERVVLMRVNLSFP